MSEQLLLCRSLLYCTASTLLSDATGTNATITITGEGGGGASVGGGGARREGRICVGLEVGEAAAVKAPLLGADPFSGWLGFGCIKCFSRFSEIQTLPPKSKV